MKVNIVYSRRRTCAVKVEKDGGVTVCAPYGLSEKRVLEIVGRHRDRIERKRAVLMEKAARMDAITPEEIARLKALAKADIPPRVAFFARQMGVTPAGVKITSAKTRFGSCSAKDSLCFSLYLMTYPPEAVDAVIVHELAHIRHKDHSSAFYAEILRVMPDYAARKKLLKNGIL